MTVTFRDPKTERRMDQAIRKMTPMVRPDKNKFIKEAIENYIDLLVQKRMIPRI